MKARTLAIRGRDELIGRKILTEAIGAWPGGLAEIIDVIPDPNAPEIVFEVRGLDPEVQYAINAGALEDETIGVFGYEEVELVPDKEKEKRLADWLEREVNKQ
jgi:hypothetical protein